MICQNILALRTRNGLTQEELALKVGVARQTVAKWESGEAIPDLDNTCKLAELEGWRPIIKEWAEKGYAFCGFVPVKSGPTGKLLVIDLVFQRA